MVEAVHRRVSAIDCAGTPRAVVGRDVVRFVVVVDAPDALAGDDRLDRRREREVMQTNLTVRFGLRVLGPRKRAGGDLFAFELLECAVHE